MSSEPQPNLLQRVMAERGLAILIGLAVIGLVMICVFGVLLLRSLNRGDDVTTGSDGSPTPFPTLVGGAGEVADALVVGVSDSSTVTVTLDAPVSLRLGEQVFNVETQTVAADGIWSPSGLGEGMAAWVYGTIVNYVVGVPATNENRDLLEQMVAGQEMVLTTRSGTQLTFTFDSRQLAPANQRDLFAQNTPGLTVALVQGGADERLVVHGTYVVPESATSGASSQFELGETAQLDNVQFTVTGAIYMPDRPEAPPGFAFFLVDYQVQNIGQTPFDTGTLRLSLLDELGNQYAISPVASQLGNQQPLSGFLNANQLAPATIGFQIPAGLASPTLRLSVARTGSPNQLLVNLPFPGGARAAQGASVLLQSVEVSPDQTSLVVTGQITNMGTQPIVVSENNISLKTADGASYLLLSINPPFPWSVGVSQALTFVVTYQRPLTADTAVFTVLQQPFQLSGLR